MYKVSIIGIDKSGKSTLVDSLKGMQGVETIHLTSPSQVRSFAGRMCGFGVEGLAKLGESTNLTTLAGLAYFSYLMPYYLEEKAKRHARMLVSDRDPLIDPICYSAVYLPPAVASTVRPLLRTVLEHFFEYPDLYLYLRNSPELSISRGKSTQLHEKTESLSRLKEFFEQELALAVKHGVPVIEVDTTNLSIQEVLFRVKYYLNGLMRSTIPLAS